MPNKLPSTWIITDLTDIALDIQPGFASRPNVGTKGISHLRPFNVTPDGRLNLSELKYVDDNPGRSDKYSLEAGDILFNNTNSPEQVGKASLIAKDLNTTFSNHMTRIRVDRQQIDPVYLWNCFRQMWRERLFEIRCTRWVNQAGFNTSMLTKLQIPLPPLFIQHRIVEILERADELRRKRAQADELVRRILPALFVKMLGDPTTNPMGWPQSTVGQLGAYVTSGATPRGGRQNYLASGIPFIRSQNVLMNRLSLESVAHISPEIHERMKRSQIQPGDVLLNITGASIGRVTWVPNKIQEANVNQHVCIIRFSHDKTLAAFTSFLLSTTFGQDQILRLQSGSTRQALNHEQVRALKLIVPPLKLQQQFVQAVSALETQRSQQVKLHTALDTLFQTLLARAFRGELVTDVTLAEAFGLNQRQVALMALLAAAMGVREPVHITPLMKYAFLFQQEGGIRREGSLAAEPRPTYLLGGWYEFEPYKYGPFAQELYHDLEALETAGLLQRRHLPRHQDALREKTAIYLVKEKAETIHGLIESLPAEVRQGVETIIAEYGSLSQRELLDLVYRQYPEYTANSERWKKNH